MEDNYPKAYREVYEILKYIPKEDLEKIPKDLIQTIKSNMDSNHTYEVNEYIEFDKQPMLRETKAILAIIYRDYWATDTQKERIVQKQKHDIQKEEEAKKEKYNYDNLFKNRTHTQNEKQELIVYEELWYMKFANFMKKVFGKSKF